MLKSLVTAGVIIALTSLALADVPQSGSFNVTVFTQRSGPVLNILQLNLEDAKPKAGVCPYYLRNLQYLEAVKVLSVEIYQELCLNDAYGKSHGDVLWVVPQSLTTTKGANVTLLVNGKTAGILVYDEVSQSFKIEN